MLCGNAARTYDGLGILVTSGVYMSLFNKRIEKEAIEKERIKVREVFADVEENGVQVRGMRIYASLKDALELYDHENVQFIMIQDVKLSKYQK